MKAQALRNSIDKYAWLRWSILVLILVTTFTSVIAGPLALVVYILPTIFVFMHGARYLGRKNIFLFFILTYVITFTAEYLGVHTGQIFGTYYYNAVSNGPLLGGVPVLLMLTYFTLAYSTYVLLRVIFGWVSVITGWKVLAISLLGGMVMTLSDLASDPVNSTVNQLYIWTQGGVFFGVPYQNFIGWLGETFLLFLVISLVFGYVTKAPQYKKQPSAQFLLEPIVLFIIPILPVVLRPLWMHQSTNIYQPMSLIALFGLGTIGLMGLIRVTSYHQKTRKT